MYETRPATALSATANLLAKDGIFSTLDVFSPNQLATLNSVMDVPFRERAAQPRSYILPDDFLALDMFGMIFNQRLRNLVLSIVPDPVLYHLHAYEIAGGNPAPHIFGDTNAGWHRDPDSEFFAGDPTHVSIFIYLRDVGSEDGPFEFSPQSPASGLGPVSRAASMTGPAGYSFAWHRSFYHRAAPNRAPRRRRVLKISFQRNQFKSAHLANPHFRKLIAGTPSGDEFYDLLLGRYQGTAAPQLAPLQPVAAAPVAARGKIDLSPRALAQLLDREKTARLEPVAYD